MRFALAALCLLALVTAALAQSGYVGGLGAGDDIGGIGGAIGFGIIAGTVGSAPSPPSCTNSLDFSQACNSQYMPVM
jgi:hypothetical protein